MNAIRFATALLLLTGALSASAQQDFIVDAMFNNGVAAYKERDFEAVKANWYRAANRGHVRAMVGLAQLYQSGEFGEPDREQAKRWYFRAARAQSPYAQYQLASLLLEDKAFDDAEDWLSKAGDNGNRQAQLLLAELYERGDTLQQSDELAAKWYQLAADNGVSEAQLKLAEFYLLGRGIEMDDSQAFNWTVRALDSGNPQAKYLLGMMYSTGTGTVYSPEVAAIWLQEAADEGVANARKLLTTLEFEQRKPGSPKPLDRDLLAASGF